MVVGVIHKTWDAASPALNSGVKALALVREDRVSVVKHLPSHAALAFVTLLILHGQRRVSWCFSQLYCGLALFEFFCCVLTRSGVMMPLLSA